MNSFRTIPPAFVLVALALAAAMPALAQENYFVTYSQQMEEPGNLEIANKSVAGAPRGGNAFVAHALEFEYGVKAWWTSELYLDAQTTLSESSLFTGFRWENRFRVLRREHWINPVFYAEFENLNGADKALLEVVGHDGRQDFLERNERSEHEREIEVKLILSSNISGWNVSENLIGEKNLSNEPLEFGYALGASRPLSLVASALRCNLCRENFAVGAELYGGLGDRHSFGLRNTSHYIAPVASWSIPYGPTIKVSPGFGLNDYSHTFLLRFGVSYEVQQLWTTLRRR